LAHPHTSITNQPLLEFIVFHTLASFSRLVLICLLALLLSGCSTARTAWDKTTDVYDTYVDPKPEIDLQRRSGLSRQEQLLAVQFSLMDQQLENVLRTLAPQDRFPDSAWFEDFMQNFPWITAILAMDTQGQILARHPEVPLKTVQAEPLLEHEWSMLNRELQGSAQDTPLGPEMIIAGPFFRDGSWQGLIVAHFDPRSLVEFSTDPEKLVLLASGELLWTGISPEATQEILNAPWQNILKGNVQGKWSTETDTFAWISRPIGSLHLIYAVSLPN
jgi:hypothetical protein